MAAEFVAELYAFVEKNLPDVDVNKINARNLQAKLEMARGDFEKAIAMQYQNVEDVENIDPELDFWRIRATVYRNLASFLGRVGRHDEAAPFLNKALAEFEKELAPEFIDARNIRTSLAWTLYSLGEREAPLALLQQNLDLVEIHQPEDPVAMSSALNGMASISRALGKQEESLSFDMRRLPLVKAAYGERSQNMINVLSSIAKSHLVLGQTNEARAYMDRSLELADSVVNKESQQWAFLQRNNMEILLFENRLDEAEEVGTLAVKLLESTTAQGNMVNFVIEAQLGKLARLKGNFAKAAKHYEAFLAANAGDWQANRILVAACLVVVGDQEKHSRFCWDVFQSLPQTPTAKESETLARCIMFAPWIAEDSELFDLAEKHAKLAHKADPNRAWPSLLLGLHSIRSGHYQKAIPFLESAVQISRANQTFRDSWCPIHADTVRLLASGFELEIEQRQGILSKAKKRCLSHSIFSNRPIDFFFHYLLLDELGEASGIPTHVLKSD